VFRKRVPGVGSGDRKSSAADGSQSDWRHDQTVSSGRTYMLGLGLGLGLVLGLFSAPLGPARTRSPMFDRLQRRNNSHFFILSIRLYRASRPRRYKAHTLSCGDDGAEKRATHCDRAYFQPATFACLSICSPSSYTRVTVT